MIYHEKIKELLKSSSFLHDYLTGLQVPSRLLLAGLAFAECQRRFSVFFAEAFSEKAFVVVAKLLNDLFNRQIG